MLDIHTHPVMIKELYERDPDLEKRINDAFGFYFPAQPLKGYLLEMDEAGVDSAVLLPIDATSAHGGCIVSNEQVAELVSQNARFIGFASVDPNLKGSAKQLYQAVRQYGLKGLKLDPSLQQFYPNDPETAYPVYTACAELQIPVLIHMGLSWVPNGLAKFADPLLMEEVAQAFPQVNFILAHFAWPWINEAAMLAIKYPNVFLDTAILYSGTPRDALKRVLAAQIGLEVVERSLADKLLFGTNFPRVDMRRFTRGIKDLGLSPKVLEKITKLNSHKLLKLE